MSLGVGFENLSFCSMSKLLSLLSASCLELMMGAVEESSPLLSSTCCQASPLWWTPTL